MNALIELKIENERLQQHIRALRAQELAATQSVQHIGSYPDDDLSAQLAANLGFPARPTVGGDPSRSYYASLPHGYEARSFPPITVLEDDEDVEPRRKKVKSSCYPVAARYLTDITIIVQEIVRWRSVYLQHLRTYGLPRVEKGKLGSVLCLSNSSLISPLTFRDPVAPKPYVMLAAFDGRKRCANSRRQLKPAIRISFHSTIPCPLRPVLVMKALLSYGTMSTLSLMMNASHDFVRGIVT